MEGVCDTPLHLFADNHGVNDRFFVLFAAMKGVCDTPLHLFADNHGVNEWFFVLFAAMKGVCDTPLHCSFSLRDVWQIICWLLA